ncbi:MAG: LysM peptidoglycan-binding domain-containing protein [Caldilineaceae bacterium]|nr:LysM peptidoglycan-binding domain-containing protein [Caldilineaceae bacterium]HRJ45481.1 LysM peptidoglycan-binding domain-containing protein [Caldilineaceae bacterium]
MSLFSPGIQAQEQTTAGRGFSLPVVRAFAVNDPDAFVYTVRLGEYWILIARKFGVSYNDLRAANPELWTLRGEIIRPGDEMAIPGLTAADQRPTVEVTVQPGDSWYAIADRFGVTYWDLRLDNLGLWRRRGAVIQPGDMMQVVNPAPAAAKEAAVAVAQSVATPTPAPASVAPIPAATSQPAVVPAPDATSTPVAPPAVPGTLPTAAAGGEPFRVSNPPANAVIYSVRPGDNWFNIASRYGMDFEKLRSANPELWALRGQNIRPADEMIIPAHGSPPPPIEIKTVPDDKPEAITDGSYTVQTGDTWATVAGRAGVTEEALKAANLDFSGRELAPGDVVRIP